VPDIKSDIDIASSTEGGVVFSRLREFLLSGDVSHDIYDAVSVYLERAPVVDWAIAERFVRYPADPLVAATTINAAAIRRCPSPEFWIAVESVAWGEAWDKGDDARIQAILALNRRPGGCNSRTKEILLRGLNDDSPIVRDSSAIAAQRCFGIPEPEVISGRGEGTLRSRIGEAIEDWLQP
jgi:hypothetical protein